MDEWDFGAERRPKSLEEAVERLFDLPSVEGGIDGFAQPRREALDDLRGPQNFFGNPELLQRWNLIVRHWRLIIAVILVAAAVGWGTSYLVSTEYESTASVMVRTQRVFGAKGDEATSFQPNEAKVLGEAEVSFFRSRPVAERVVRALHLDEEKPITDPIKRLRRELRKILGRIRNYAQYGYVIEPDPFEAAIEAYRESVVAAPIFQSSLLIIIATAGEPDTAAAIANEATKAFVEYAQTVYGGETRERRIFLEGQLRTAQEKMEKARSDLLSYRQANHIANIDEEIIAKIAYVARLEQTLQETEDQIAGMKVQSQLLDAQIDKEPPTQLATRKSTTEASDTTTIEGDETSTGTAIRSSTAIEDQAQDEMSSQISASAQETRSASSRATDYLVDVNPLYRALRADKLELERTLSDLEERKERIQATLRQQREQLDDLAELSSEVNRLTQESSWAYNYYTNLRAEYEKVQLEEAYRIEEIHQVDVATPLLYPERPIRILYLAVGAALGSLGGVILVIGREAWRQRKSALPPTPPPDYAITAPS